MWVGSPEVADSAWCTQSHGGAVGVSLGVVFDTVQEKLIARMDSQLAALPACPRVHRDAQCSRHLCLGQIQHGPQATRIRIQIRPRTRSQAANSGGHVREYTYTYSVAVRLMRGVRGTLRCRHA